MDFFYKKNNHPFDEDEIIGATRVQNYIPLYNKFFELNESNWNSINLNNKQFVTKIEERFNDNKYRISITDSSDNILVRNSFIKFSPLIDPVKYIIDKYDAETDICTLPSLSDNKCHTKMLDTNNVSYVDSFFSFLSSALLHNYNLANGIDFYGSFLGIKSDFVFNIEDEIDILNETEEFHRNRDKKYSIPSETYEKLFNNSTKKNKHKIVLDTTDLDVKGEEDLLNLSDIKDLECLDEIFNIDSKILRDITDGEKVETNTNELLCEYECENPEVDIKEGDKDKDQEKDKDKDKDIDKTRLKGSGHRTNSTSSSCSSRSSNTQKTSDESDESSDPEDEEEESSEEEPENVFIKIKEFPVQLIFLENCNNTLDNYIENNKIRDDEWDSIILQILFTLITYQQVFDFTHNDLHTNNIVYNVTEKKYLYYRFGERHYRVPTFGKIYKIIDFGRAIYRFKGNLLCSDSFSRDGDAHTQYNFEPYFNADKPRLEPNRSFDLCRLGCSLFDFLIDDIEDVKRVKSPIKKIILEWIKDDKGRNVLYKNNGDERYPDFKLYKMIARSVHNHVPTRVLENKHFDKYQIAKKRINTPQQIINIDAIPIMK